MRTPPTSPPSLRLSSTMNACPRRAVYEATNAPGRERTDRENRWLYRGKSLGRDYAAFLQARHPGTQLELERKVTWPLGTGHIDVYFPETRSAIEVLSSAHASEQMVRGKLRQLVGYIEHDPDANNGALIILNPVDFTEERIIIRPGTPVYDELLIEMLARVAQVQAWRRNGQLPQRVCAKPADAFGHFCLHAGHCFEDWQPAPLDEIDTPEAREVTHRVALLKLQEREIKTTLASVEGLRKTAEAELAEIVPVGKVAVGPYEVTRSHVVRRSFKLPLAEQDSRLPPDLLAEFTTTSEHDRFTLKRVSREPALAATDYGEEAPW